MDALFIRSLLCSFFFKIFPEIIEDGRLFIAEPPLYRVNDKKDPFVINKEDYLRRYVKEVMKNYSLGWKNDDEFEKMPKELVQEFLYDTGSYVDDLQLLSQHYKVNDRLLEIIIWRMANVSKPSDDMDAQLYCRATLEAMNKHINDLMVWVMDEFPEIYHDEKDKLIKGVINGRYQSIELSESLIRRSIPITNIHHKYNWEKIYLKEVKTGTEHFLSFLEALKILKKFQPDILHRFKGLGENNPEDIEFTTMNPNTRSLIRVHISDIENDMKVFQILRGTSPQDAAARKQMMKTFVISKDMIDT